VRVSGAFVFSLALAALAAFAVYTALRWPPKAALFPLTMGIPLLVLALAQAVAELRYPQPAPAAAAGAGRRTLVTFAWMASFIALVLLVGFPVTVPAFVFFYLLLESRESWRLSLAAAAAAWGFFHVLFQRVLHFPFDSGLILIGF
jgi:hypothetical protein